MSENKSAKTPSDDGQPVAWAGTSIEVNWTPIYTELPKREWVGLTDEEICALWAQHDLIRAHDRKRQAFARAIEAKLREKNGGEYRNGATTERTRLNQENT